MKLLKITIEGVGRFADRTSLLVAEKTVALVGPNEAGKSTILKAIAAAARGESLDGIKTRNRSETDPASIEFLYALDASERTALSERFDCLEVTNLKTIWNGETLVWQPTPRPQRDRSLRKRASELMETWYEALLHTDDETGRALIEIANSLGAALAADVEELPPASLQLLNAIRDQVDRSDDSSADAISVLDQLAEYESSPAPVRWVIDQLEAPDFLLFGDEHRDLRSFYTLDELRSPPAALANLASLGELSLPRVMSLLGAFRPRAEGLIESANKTIRARFDEEWNQSRVFPKLYLDSTGLHVYISTEDVEYTFTDLSERSDGLRMFVALRAFLAMASQTEKPVLLIDEIEQHLHYDAQVDIVNILTKQLLAQKVIYTTHSIGSLPIYQGGSVRSIVRSPGTETSRIVNDVWQPGIGFVPMLRAMGSTLLLTTAPGTAVVCEGATEVLLMPALLGTLEDPDLGSVRVLPGLAGLTDHEMKDLDLSAGRSVFLVDGDGGGARLAARLVASGVKEARILNLGDVLGEGATIEDFVDPTLLAKAFSDELRDWRGFEVTATSPNSETGRFDALVAQLPDPSTAPSKPQLAARIREIVASDQETPLVDPAHRKALEAVGAWIRRELLTSPADKLLTNAPPS